jgi:plasmid maintenance system antidote protein VapI
MEATAKEIRLVKQMVMDGNSHEKIAKLLNVTLHRVTGIISKIKNEDVTISFAVTLERVKEIEKEMFNALDNYKANPTFCNLDKVNNMKQIYSRCVAI